MGPHSRKRLTAQVARRRSRGDGAAGLCSLLGLSPQARKQGGWRAETRWGRIALCKPIKQFVCLARQLMHRALPQKFQAKPASNPITAIASSYQNIFHSAISDRSLVDHAGISPRQATHFLTCRHAGSPESKQRTPPYRPRPCASLRANLRHAIWAALPPNSLRGMAASLGLAAASQTRQPCPAAALPKARIACCRRRHTGGYGRHERVVAKLACQRLSRLRKQLSGTRIRYRLLSQRHKPSNPISAVIRSAIQHQTVQRPSCNSRIRSPLAGRL